MASKLLKSFTKSFELNFCELDLDFISLRQVLKCRLVCFIETPLIIEFEINRRGLPMLSKYSLSPRLELDWLISRVLLSGYHG